MGRSSAKHSSGLETMSVVATASTRRPVRRERDGARISPAKADVPAPVKTTRSSGSASSGRRNASMSSLRDATGIHLAPDLRLLGDLACRCLAALPGALIRNKLRIPAQILASSRFGLQAMA